MRIRIKNKTTIQFILVANDSPIVSPILPPEAFNNEVIEFIKRSPTDILQVFNSVAYLESSLKNLWFPGVDFHIFFIKDFVEIKDTLNSPQLQFFFIDGESNEHIDLYRVLSQDRNVFRLFHFYNVEKVNFNAENIIYSPSHFFEYLIVNQKQIIAHLEIDNIELSPSISLEYKNFNEFYFFAPTRLNYFQLNRIIGNFGNDFNIQTDEEIAETQKEEFEKANKKKNSFERQKLYIHQLEKLDLFFHFAYEEEVLKPVNGIQPLLPPMIVVLPFHNPDIKDIYGEKRITDLLQVEQTQNYISEISTGEDIKLALAGSKLIRERVKYLDDVSYLHSSFNFSPVVRFPIQGKSIYKELSYFRPEFFPNLTRATTRKKLKKTIYRFGDILQKRAIAPELKSVLKKRNGQIVAISDVPIEWALLDGVPLSFSHDICRLPETSLHGLMSLFASNRAFEYSIPIDIINRTLVIHGADDVEFKGWQEQATDLAQSKGFIVEKCTTLKQVKETIKEYNPEFIVFDCHGGFDKNTRSTYLHIGNEKLDGNYVVENDLSAPLVFLSACGTAPTFGTLNPIANAFFEAGSFSVTSTYLPISIDLGSILYLRLLNNLSYAANHSIHKNWLGFICHVIRTSSINDAYRKAFIKEVKIDPSSNIKSNIEALGESLAFSRRRKLFTNMDKRLNKLTKTERLYFSEVIPEYLLYSNMGRGDLILFDSWKKEHDRKNTI